MKLSTAIITITAAVSALTPGAAARSIVTPLSGINLFPEANYEIEVNAANTSAIDGLGRLYGRLGLTRARAYGVATLHLPLLGRIEEKVGRDNINAAMDKVSQVQTLRLRVSGAWHTDVEVDKRPQQRKSPKDKPLQVGLFFSNTNEDAYFETMDGELCIPVKEETFVSFDGRLPHRTVVMSGHADMVGPFSLSSDVLLNVGVVLHSQQSSAKATFGGGTRRQRQRMIEEGDDTTNTSSTSTDAEINGFVTITGYKDGIDPSGEKNTTLEVKYNLEGCNGAECSVLEVEDNPNFCDEVPVGELDNDNSAGDVDIIDDISTTNEVVEYINVNTSVNTFFGSPVVVQDAKGRVLACAVLQEITSNYTDVSAEAEGTPMDDSALSGAISSASVAVWVSLVSSIIVIAALF